jgi:hypothetical protein
MACSCGASAKSRGPAPLGAERCTTGTRYDTLNVMKKLTILLIIVTTFVLVACPVFAAEFRAGIAARNVTPDRFLPVSGGAGPSRPTNKKEGELVVRALVLDDGTVRIAIASADFLGFPGVLCNKVRAAVKGIPPENILIGATHTHSAPDCYAFPDGKGGTDADLAYVESVCSRMADAINEAVAKLAPARLKIATGQTLPGISYNYYAEKLYDPRCHVIQAIDEAGKPIATLVNYATHPEVIGNSRGIMSPDLVGPLYDRIAESGGGTGIFMNSAQGGMVTADNRRPGGLEASDWAECQRIGRLLADEALRIVKDAPIQATPKLFCAARPLTFPVDSILMQNLMKSLPWYRTTPGAAGSNAETITTQLNLVNIGNAQILTIPGEALPNIGFYLKRKMRGQNNLLFGLTNDAFGYILTKEDFDSFERYTYVSRTSLGERTGAILVDEALKLVNECPPPEKLSRN